MSIFLTGPASLCVALLCVAIAAHAAMPNWMCHIIGLLVLCAGIVLLS